MSGGAAFPDGPVGEGWGRVTHDYGSIRRGFRVQLRVIHALFFREIQTRFGRSGLGFIWLFIEPAILTMAIASMKLIMNPWAQQGGISVVLFAVAGYAPFFAWRAIVGRASGALSSNVLLLYHRQVKLVDVMAARNALEVVAVTGVVAALLGSAAWLMEFMPNDIPLIVLGLLILFAWAHGLAMLIAAAAARWDGIERFIHPLTYLALPISGALVALDWMPREWREVILWNPQAHMHELIRDGFFGDRLMTYYDWEYMIPAVLIANLMGLVALRAARPHLEA